MTKESHTPTEEQATIIASAKASKANLMIQALAGTSKTSTLESIERAVPRGPVLYLVFNKNNADEASKRMLTITTTRTFNSMGHRICPTARNISIDGQKTNTILRSIISHAQRD